MRLVGEGPPTTLSYVTQSADNRGVKSVCVLQNGQLVTGGEGFIEIRDRNLSVIKSVDIKGLAVCIRRYVTTDGSLAVGVYNKPNLVVSVYSSELKFVRKLVEVKTGSGACQFDLSSSFIAVASDSPKCLKLFSADCRHLSDIQLSGMSYPRGVCITADQQFVLVSDWRGLVRKYQLAGDHKLMWECQGLIWPTGITESELGEFYVSSGDEAEIYQLSDKGK